MKQITHNRRASTESADVIMNFTGGASLLGTRQIGACPVCTCVSAGIIKPALRHPFAIVFLFLCARALLWVQADSRQCEFADFGTAEWVLHT